MRMAHYAHSTAQAHTQRHNTHAHGAREEKGRPGEKGGLASSREQLWPVAGEPHGWDKHADGASVLALFGHIPGRQLGGRSPARGLVGLWVAGAARVEEWDAAVSLAQRNAERSRGADGRDHLKGLAGINATDAIGSVECTAAGVAPIHGAAILTALSAVGEMLWSGRMSVTFVWSQGGAYWHQGSSRMDGPARASARARVWAHVHAHAHAHAHVHVHVHVHVTCACTCNLC
jgi:hypothetical protein